MNWEVQTMPSKTSFCNGTEFRKCLSRWWPLWVIYGVILFIMLPGVLLNARSTIPYVSAEQISYLSNVILSETQMLLPLTAFCAGLLAAAAMFGYLYTPRGAGLAASLPIRRGCMFRTHLLAGLVMLLSASGTPQVLTLFGMSVGTSVAVINYISRLFTPIESLGMEIQTIQSAMAGVKRIDAFLAQPEREMLAEEGASMPRGDVVVSHVTFGYDERTVLRDLSFTVKSGEQVTLVGRTGAGKSTVFKLLMGLYQPKAGTITIGGVDVLQITDRQRRGCIGCVEQHFARVPGTVLDQITLGDPRISREMAQNAARLAGLDATIDALPAAYDTPCSDGLFSQGEWQLLCIARAAAADPAVLLLDEITANLDAETEARVLEALRRASVGRTVLSISHRVYEKLGGRVIEIKALDEGE